MLCFVLGTTYDKKWKGLCFNGQEYKPNGQTHKQKPERLNPQECKEKCTMDSSCTAFASNPEGPCYLTKRGQTVSHWTETHHLAFTCYAKTTGTSFGSSIV